MSDPSQKHTITYSEQSAYQLLYSETRVQNPGDFYQRCHEAAEYIIQLADEIKAERKRNDDDLQRSLQTEPQTLHRGPVQHMWVDRTLRQWEKLRPLYDSAVNRIRQKIAGKRE